MAHERTGHDRIDLPRRRVFTGAGAVGAAAVLAACEAEPNDPGSFEVPEEPADNQSSGDGSGNDDSGGGDGSSDGDDQAPQGLVATADVAVGGGVILGDQDVVVTQPEEGNWQAFSATCTHQGCLVSEIRDDVIYCSCHGSEFSIRDGSVVQEASGVAAGTQEGLAPVNVEVDGDWVVRA